MEEQGLFLQKLEERKSEVQQPTSQAQLPPSSEASSLKRTVAENEARDSQAQAGSNRLNNVIERIERMYAAPNKIFLKAMEEQGCQLLLQKLEERKLEDIQMIFPELKDHICKLMFNRFGSDVILKLFEVCNEEQKNQLISSVTADARLLISVCLDPQGSATMQKFIGFPMEQKQVHRIMRFISYFVVPLANHPSGSQVVVQCFKIFPVPAEETMPLLDTINQFWLELAVDENGSNLLKFLISEQGSGVRSIVESILVRLNFYPLSRNKFGSSLIQHVIGLLKPNQLQNLVYDMLGICVRLSYYNYGRDVVKKLIGASKAKHAPQIISTMITDPELLGALIDTCGLSFLKSFKKYAKGTDRKVLNDLINQCSQLLKKNIRNLKVMANMGLSVEQEKYNQFQKIKQEVADMVKLQSVYMQSKVEQQNASLDDFQEAGRGDGETLKRKYSMDSALENKICDLYDLCVERLEEESGPPVRRLYEELANLWPSGVMDTEGVKRAISREKDRRRALKNRRKDQEKIKNTKVLTPKTEDATRGDGINITRIYYLQQKLSIDYRDHSATSTSNSNLVTPSQAQQLSSSDPGPKDITYRRGMHGKFRSIA